MGRKTFQGIKKALPGRLNIVLTRTLQKSECEEKSSKDDLLFFNSFENAICYLNFDSNIESIFVIGGMELWKNIPLYYEHFFHKMYISIINTREIMRLMHAEETYHYDGFVSKEFIKTHFPFQNVKEKSKIKIPEHPLYPIKYVWKTRLFLSSNYFSFHKNNISKPFTDEKNYLDLVHKIIHTGDYRKDRTGVGALSCFGNVLRYSLRGKKIPIITTKRVFLRGIIHELLWFISGSTDAKLLSAKGVKIWDANTSKEFFEKNGINREEGDCGGIYGWQWRHWGAKYIDCHTDYYGQGIDQLAEVIHKIKTNPYDRRLIVSAWNVSDLKSMALPPCHMFFQFFVANNELSCMMYQRSADIGLGVPFNITSYALLTHMIAHICNLEAAEFIHVMGDTHVYVNHVEPLTQQLKNDPDKFADIEFARKIDDIDVFKFEDIIIKNYNPKSGTIKMEMAV